MFWIFGMTVVADHVPDPSSIEDWILEYKLYGESVWVNPDAWRQMLVPRFRSAMMVCHDYALDIAAFKVF